MDQLQKLFNYNGHSVRTVIKDGEPWFVLSDVCKALDLSTPAKVRERLDDGVSSTHTITDSLGREQQATIINEDGLYDVILESRKPEAKQFRKWITSEVIPSIRKTGSYSLQAPKSQAELMLMYAEQFVNMEKRVEQMEDTVTTIQETFLRKDADWRKSVNATLNKAAFKLGGQYRDLRNRSYEILEQRGRCDLNKRLRNLLDRLEQQGATKTQIDKTSKMDVIEQDARLKEIYSTIVKELAIGSLRLHG